MAFLLGVPIPGDWTDETRRQYLKQIPALLKIKGTHLHFAKKAAFYDHKDVWLVELWKSVQNEDRFYSQHPSTFYSLKSARVDMLACSGTCESICESICEEGFQTSGEYVQPSAAEAILNELGQVLPVHVLLRRQARYVEPNEFFEQPNETLGCHTVCESICVTACQLSEQAWPGSYVESFLSDAGPSPYDSWAFSTICIRSCESICQTCCECGQEGTCTTVCEVSCQLVCANNCQTNCMQSCQQSCQDDCMVQCAATCEWSCMNFCESICETLCEADIEGTGHYPPPLQDEEPEVP